MIALFLILDAKPDPNYRRQILSDEEMERLQRDGFLILRNLLTPSEKEHFTQMIDEIENWPLSDDKWFTYFETVNGERKLSRLECFYNYHPEMKKLVEGKLGQAASDIMGEQVTVLKDKINFKHPGGIGYDAHQDQPGYTMFGQDYHLSALVPADPMTIENGCLKLVKGDWKSFLPLDNNGDIKEEIAKDFVWKPVICDAGTVVLFNSYVPHKSDPNTTDKARRALYITWNGISHGEWRDEFYGLRRKVLPSDHLKDPNKDYTEGVTIFKEHILEMGNERMPKADRGDY